MYFQTSISNSFRIIWAKYSALSNCVIYDTELHSHTGNMLTVLQHVQKRPQRKIKSITLSFSFIL